MPHTSTSNLLQTCFPKFHLTKNLRGGGGGGGGGPPPSPHCFLCLYDTVIFPISCSEYYGLLKCPLLLLHSACMYNNVYDTQVNERYRNQLCVPSDAVAVFEEDGGLLMASKAVAAYQV